MRRRAARARRRTDRRARIQAANGKTPAAVNRHLPARATPKNKLLYSGAQSKRHVMAKEMLYMRLSSHWHFLHLCGRRNENRASPTAESTRTQVRRKPMCTFVRRVAYIHTLLPHVLWFILWCARGRSRRRNPHFRFLRRRFLFPPLKLVGDTRQIDLNPSANNAQVIIQQQIRVGVYIYAERANLFRDANLYSKAQEPPRTCSTPLQRETNSWPWSSSKINVLLLISAKYPSAINNVQREHLALNCN